jgi:AraC-like DNA-binding protein
MTDRHEFFADPPDWPAALMTAEEPDALSDVLDAVHLRGGAVLRCAPATPFVVTVPARVRVLHILERGSLRLRTDDMAADGSPVETVLGEGDLVLLARGDAHTMRAGPGAGEPRPLRADDCYTDGDGSTDTVPAGGDCSTDTVPAGGDGPRWLTGTFTVDEAVADPLLAVLPPMVVVPAAGQDWLQASVRLLVAEITAPRPGRAVMISRILDLLFVHVLRVWAEQRPAGPVAPGWLTAATDPRLGQVITAINRDLRRPWSVDDLAGLAELSRSVFAERFTRLLGNPPSAYLAQRRLDRAAELLRSTSASVGAVADEVGYTSEAAFSRAFRRRHGIPPLRWRRADH